MGPARLGESGRDRRALAGRLALTGVAVAALGELGHQIFDRLGQALAHHWFHALFAGGAGLVFIGFVVADVRRNGRPRLSWRLRPPG